jgi:hypothetical protein
VGDASARPLVDERGAERRLHGSGHAPIFVQTAALAHIGLGATETVAHASKSERTGVCDA